MLDNNFIYILASFAMDCNVIKPKQFKSKDYTLSYYTLPSIILKKTLTL